jgi:hypothetical protein
VLFIGSWFSNLYTIEQKPSCSSHIPPNASCRCLRVCLCGK